MPRWKFIIAACLALPLGAGTALLLQRGNARVASNPVFAAKLLADKKTEPDAQVLQATYDFEIELGNTVHDAGLRVLKAQCMPGQESAFICFVSVTTEGDPGQRIYNSVTEIARVQDGWSLKSGLCKRQQGPDGYTQQVY